MQEIYRVLARLTQTDLTVMINGESGTGKELVARVLHDYGRRRQGPFVAINMAAIPRELVESELFGHEKGAFTGAQTRTQGRFEQAEGGTLFLDEIGDMPLDAQTRLLRVLQEGEYTTVGGRTPIKTNVRIIAATHRDLKSQIQQGLFREDLFYRLNVVPIRIPPLRERLEDVGDLVRHFLRQAAREGLGQKSIEAAAIDRLKAHPWPGNIRELENFVRRVAALYTQDTLTSQIIEQELAEALPDKSNDGGSGDAKDLSEQVERYLAGYFAGFGKDLPPPGLYERVIRQVELPLLDGGAWRPRAATRSVPRSSWGSTAIRCARASGPSTSGSSARLSPEVRRLTCNLISKIGSGRLLAPWVSCYPSDTSRKCHSPLFCCARAEPPLQDYTSALVCPSGQRPDSPDHQASPGL